MSDNDKRVEAYRDPAGVAPINAPVKPVTPNSQTLELRPPEGLRFLDGEATLVWTVDEEN